MRMGTSVVTTAFLPEVALIVRYNLGMSNCPNCGSPINASFGACVNCGFIPTQQFSVFATKRNLGIALLAFGGLLTLYYWVVFDVAAPGSEVVNLGRMNDRIVGMITGLGAVGAGLALFLTSGTTGSVPSAGQQPRPAPTPPRGFNVPLPQALQYARPAVSLATTSLPAYKRQVSVVLTQKGIPDAYTDQQYVWANDHNVPPDRFVEFIGYIELVRGGLRPRALYLLLDRRVLITGIVLATIVGISIAVWNRSR
jgi:hypothetical protein